MPKDETAPAQPVMYSFTPEQLADLLKANRPSMAEQLELIKAQAAANAEASRAALRPENSDHPGISVFSRLGGEKTNPKSPTGELKSKMTWAGTPLEYETITADEFDLLQQLLPGEYRCTRQDGTKFPVSITTRTNSSTGTLEQVDIFFATRGQLHHGLPPLTQMCREMIDQHASKTKVA